MKRTYKYYLKLTKSQKQKLESILKNCHWLYNHLLEQFRVRDKNQQKQLTEYPLINSLPKIKESYPFLKQVHSSNLQEISKSVYKVWQKYRELKKLDPEKKYPKFKPLHRYNSFTYSQPIEKISCGYKIDNSPLTKKKENKKLRLVLGQQNHHNVYLELKMTMERNIDSEIKILTIIRKNRRYYACFSCNEIETKPLPKVNQKVGIDVNLNKKSYITLSNGTKYKHPQHYKKVEEKLQDKNRILSRKTKKSNNWKDAKFQLAKKWEKVVNQFKHYSYQVANELVKNYDNIAIENLRIDKMVKNHRLAKSIQQARWGILFQVLAEAAEIATRQLVRVNPRNTSQTCSDCGELAQEKLTLNQRIFRCWNCELELDRDVNSARNILNIAIKENKFDQNLPLNKENNF